MVHRNMDTCSYFCNGKDEEKSWTFSILSFCKISNGGDMSYTKGNVLLSSTLF